MIGTSSFLVALVSCLVTPLIHVFLNNYTKGMIRNNSLSISSFAPYIIWYIIVIKLNMIQSNIDSIIGILTILSIILIYVEIFSMITRGFSLQIMQSIKNSANNLNGIVNSYSNNRGPTWLVEKRINNLISLKLLKQEGDILFITSKRTEALVFLFIIYKKIFKLNDGG